MKLKYNLDLLGTMVLALVLMLTLRSYVPSLERFLSLPPHYYEFNMYVKTINSPTKLELPAPDYKINNKYLLTNEDLRNRISSLGVPIFMARWKVDERVVNDYFCKNIDQLLPNLGAENLKTITISWVQNKEHSDSREIQTKCN